MSKPPSDNFWAGVLLGLALASVMFLLLWLLSPKAHGSEQSIPTIVAQRALSGDFGVLASWQTAGYRHLLKYGAEKKIAWLTCYWTGEPGVGTRTASGRRVSSQVCAMLNVPFGTPVLVDLPKGYELRIVWDRGSRKNLLRARHRGAVTWLDRYIGRSAPYREKNATYIRPIFVAGGQP